MNSKEKKAALRKITGVSVSFMTVALLFSSVFSGDNVERTTLWAKSIENAEKTVANNNVNKIEIIDENTPTSGDSELAQAGFVFNKEKMSDNYVVIPKQDKENGLATIIDEYNYRSVYLDITEKYKDFYNLQSVVRYSKSEIFTG